MNVEEVYEEIDEKVVLSLKGKEPKEVNENLEKMYNYIIDLMNKSKWEEAYQMGKRWNFCVEWLNKQSSIDIDIAKKYYSPKKQNDVESLLKEIKLEIEINCLRRQRTLKNQSNLDIKNKQQITCEELYKIMHNLEMAKVKVLIIDLKNAEDFAAQKMAFQNNLINIPESTILLNKEASYYEHVMDNNAAVKRFQKRADTDLIVLVDWGSTSNKLNAPISIFKCSLEEHDEITNYNRIAILQGGFDEWMKHYPNLVQQQVLEPEIMKKIAKQIENDFGHGSPASTNQNTNTSSPVLSEEASTFGALLFSPNCEVQDSIFCKSLHQASHEKEELFRMDITSCKKPYNALGKSLLHLFVDYAVAQQSDTHTQEEIIDCVKMLQSKSSNNMTSFQTVVKKRLTRLLPILLAFNNDVNYIDVRGRTILHIFALHYTDRNVFPRADPCKDREILEALLERGASVIVGDITKNTPVHYAATNRRADLVQLMLDSFTDVNAVNNDGNTILHDLVVIYKENPNDLIIEVIRTLMSKGASFQIKNKKGSSAIDLAIKYCLIRVLTLFEISTELERLFLCICQEAENWSDRYHEELEHLDRLINVSKSMSVRNEECHSTPLHYVAKFGRIEAVRMLLNAGADIDAKRVDGVTLLHLAMTEGHLDVAKYLIERGADIHARDTIFHFGLVHVASLEGDERMINLLVDIGLNVEDENGFQPLHFAAFNGNDRVVKALIGHGADVNCRTPKRQLTPLHAIWMTEIVGKRGASSIQRDGEFTENHMKTLILLVQTGANVNARDSRSRTPLHYLTRNLNYPSASNFLIFLLEHGARVDVTDVDNKTPLINSIDSWVDSSSRLKTLLEYGADVDDIGEILRAERDQIRYYHLVLETIGTPIVAACNVLLELIGEQTLDAMWRSRVNKNPQSLRSEMEKLKTSCLRDGETMMYDFLRMDWKRRYGLAQDVLSVDLKSEYPIYHIVIENLCRRAINRKLILNLATSALTQLAGFKLPDICTEMIFKFMSVKEIAAFIDIVESFAL